jgi:Ser-tRNA(Ala) deacylase AlaX
LDQLSALIQISIYINQKIQFFILSGGGQPNDEGTIIKLTDQQEFQVKNVIRKGPKAIHVLSDGNDPLVNLKVGDEVSQKINWDRRFDHMQQHSAQHLITALFEKEYNYNTKGKWMGFGFGSGMISIVALLSLVARNRIKLH